MDWLSWVNPWIFGFWKYVHFLNLQSWFNDKVTFMPRKHFLHRFSPFHCLANIVPIFLLSGSFSLHTDEHKCLGEQNLIFLPFVVKSSLCNNACNLAFSKFFGLPGHSLSKMSLLKSYKLWDIVATSFPTSIWWLSLMFSFDWAKKAVHVAKALYFKIWNIYHMKKIWC